MPIEQYIGIKGPGPTGNLLYSFDERGVYDEVVDAILTPFMRINVQNIAADAHVWVCEEGIWVVAGAAESHTVVGGASYAVQVVHCAQGVAVASGTAQLAAVLDLTVTAPAHSFGTLIATPTQFTKGDVLGIDVSGTLGSYAGVVSIRMKKVG
jgi:hypothetical protein